MDRSSLNPDAIALEEAFFAMENKRLLEEMRTKHRNEKRREGIRSALSGPDDAVVDHLLELGLEPETVLALAVVPLAVVAWADGEVQAHERTAILAAAAEQGVVPGEASHTVLTSWLENRPSDELYDAWKRYVASIWPRLTEAERADMRERVLGRARQVAEAAGGFLGLGRKISKAEEQVLDKLALALS